jgi:hypothetical protein
LPLPTRSVPCHQWKGEPRLTRRISLGGLAATAGAFLLPSAASARFLSKLPWKEILGVAANLATLVEVISTALMGSGGGAASSVPPTPPPICSANTNDLTTINRLCFQLALATNTKDYQAAADCFPRWLRTPPIRMLLHGDTFATRRSCPRALPSSFSTSLGATAASWTLSTPTRARVLNEVRTGLRVVNEAVWTTHVLGSELDDPANAKEVFATLERLPGLLDRALRASAELIEARSKTRCSPR